jgi:hypothetical protein
MSFLDSGTVAGIRQAADGLFWDAGVILRRDTPSVNTKYGDYGAKYGNHDDKHPALETETKCRLSMSTMNEVRDWSELSQGKGILLLPASCEGTIGKNDRFRLTSKFGSALSTPLVFAVDGEPQMSILGLKMDVQLVPEP